MSVQDLKFTKSHEWVNFTADTEATVGITDHAQQALGDLVFVNLPQEGDELVMGEAFSDVESVKAVSDIFSPVSGSVVAVNEALLDAPETINADAYGAWFVKVADITDSEALMSFAEYEAFCAEEG